MRIGRGRLLRFKERNLQANMLVAVVIVDTEVHSAIGVHRADVSAEGVSGGFLEDGLDCEFELGGTVVDYAADCGSCHKRRFL